MDAKLPTEYWLLRFRSTRRETALSATFENPRGTNGSMGIDLLGPASVLNRTDGAGQSATQQLVQSIKMRTDTVVAGVAIIILDPVALAV